MAILVQEFHETIEGHFSHNIWGRLALPFTHSFPFDNGLCPAPAPIGVQQYWSQVWFGVDG